MGLLAGVCGSLSNWIGGFIADHYATRDLRAFGTIPAIAALMSIPFSWAAFLAPAALAGFGLGALVVGGVSDAFQHHLGLTPAEGVRWALLCASLGGVLAALLFWRTRRYIRAEVIT